MKYPNVYGIDMPTVKELIAHGREIDEICKDIGADWLIYQDLEDLIAASAEGNPEIKRFECSVFDGCYVTKDIDDDYLLKLDEARNDSAKAAQSKKLEQSNNAMLGIYNDG